jgi:hypothetical protein
MSSGFGASGPGPTGDGMRVGSAEREAIAGELREHYASGRLTLEELNERVEAAFAAKTRADLSAVMRDLPSAQSFPPPTAGAPGPGQQWGGQPWGAGPPGGGAGGPGTGWGHGDWGHAGWGAGGPGAGYRGACGAGRRAGSLFSTMVAVALLGLFGVMAVAGFGIGGGRPLGIGLLIAAVALLRRLIFGRRRARGGGRSRRRW